MKVILASNNKGKIIEIRSVLSTLNISLVSQHELGIEDADETASTFVENALIKARHAARKANLPAIADDSGLVVPALNGAPGIYTARYAGTPSNSENNNLKLLSELKNVPDDQRQATFHCVIVYLKHENDPAPIICDGTWTGVIAKAPHGEKGFGYDPVFFDPQLQKTAAELPLEIKNQLSHRGKALQLLLQQLREQT